MFKLLLVMFNKLTLFWIIITLTIKQFFSTYNFYIYMQTNNIISYKYKINKNQKKSTENGL
ncbi:hypothetical protein PPBDW_I21470 [Photobacterium kishitanii]|nr:hypothetical protein PPBDW_I21470 [Photobacterium kishitanii]